MSDTPNTLFERPLSDAARAYLRKVKHHGGRLVFTDAEPQGLAVECRRAGYVHISDSGMILLTGLGQAYLDRLMRAN
ncbi:hypothetical protein FB480_103435 [Agrobacterium vitis]|nr:hypothetical protein FB480_103435 [Agrobacterium vitis]